MTRVVEWAEKVGGSEMGGNTEEHGGPERETRLGGGGTLFIFVAVLGKKERCHCCYA